VSPTDAPERRGGLGSACNNCLRRGWLLAELGALLDCNHRADGRLLGHGGTLAEDRKAVALNLSVNQQHMLFEAMSTIKG